MRVGFIGLGVQGKPLAINLANAGYDLAVFDLAEAPLKELAAAGATVAANLHELAVRSDVVAVCVLNDAQVRAVVLGPGGLLPGLRRGGVIAVHSTVSPALVTELAAAAAEHGVELVDAPVSGGEAAAKARTMSYMVGGSDAAFETCRPLFETSGPKITRTGPVGSAARAKLVHQIIVCGNMLAAYEGMRVGVEAGLSREVLEKVVREGAAQSRIADHWFELSLRSFAIPTFYKDLQLCLGFAHELGVSVPGAALAQQLIEDIVP
jgi:3-hydroxyisobutyrate dehydrogenase-like beta-hydroxyacid dehydrogenase